MPEIIILGSSSGDPSANRACASILINQHGKYYQFDAGDGCASAIQRLKIDHSSIGTIIISHTHPDHITGLFLEIQMMHLSRRRAPLKIYLPSESLVAVENFMQAAYLFDTRLGFKMELLPIIPDPIFRDENIAVYARANSHLGKYKDIIEEAGLPNKMQSYSFVIKTGDSKLIYSGDVGSIDDYADLLPGCDILITEGLHLDILWLFRAVASNNIRHLILTHLSDDMYRNPEFIVSAAQRHGVKSLSIAEDGMVLDF